MSKITNENNLIHTGTLDVKYFFTPKGELCYFCDNTVWINSIGGVDNIVFSSLDFKIVNIFFGYRANELFVICQANSYSHVFLVKLPSLKTTLVVKEQSDIRRGTINKKYMALYHVTKVTQTFKRTEEKFKVIETIQQSYLYANKFFFKTDDSKDLILTDCSGWSGIVYYRQKENYFSTVFTDGIVHLGMSQHILEEHSLKTKKITKSEMSHDNKVIFCQTEKGCTLSFFEPQKNYHTLDINMKIDYFSLSPCGKWIVLGFKEKYQLYSIFTTLQSQIIQFVTPSIKHCKNALSRFYSSGLFDRNLIPIITRFLE